MWESSLENRICGISLEQTKIVKKEIMIIIPNEISYKSNEKIFKNNIRQFNITKIVLK